MSSLGFWSTNPIKRRIAESVESRSPGFYGIITSVDRNRKTVTVVIQGGDYILYDVRYNTVLESRPKYIAINACVHVRHAQGSKFQFEVDSPAIVVPTPKAGGSPFNPVPSTNSYVLNGVSVVPASGGGLRICVLTGTIRLGGVLYTLECAKLGENLNSKVSKLSGTLPGIPRIGHLATLGDTYVTIPLNASPALLGGIIQYRYDSLQIGADSPSPIVHLVEGTNASIPKAPSQLDSSHIILAYINRRSGQTDITWNDIDSSITFVADSVNLTATCTYTMMPWTQLTNTIIVQARGFTGMPLPSISVTAEIQSGTGSISPLVGTANANGQVSFIYTRTGGIEEHSPILRFYDSTEVGEAIISFILLDVDGNPL